MNDISIHILERPTRAELTELYASVEWAAYTSDPDGLVAAVRNSTFVVTARQHGQLVGLARCLSDDVAIAYLQDILVSPKLQRRGVGSLLLEACLERYVRVRNFVLLTDDRPEQRAFYAAHGFTNVAESTSPRLNAFVRLCPLPSECSSASPSPFTSPAPGADTVPRRP